MTLYKRGSRGEMVRQIQKALHLLADGIFGSQTEAAVRAFQQVFGLTADGIVGPATWYSIVRLYTAITRLSELRSQGQQFYAINWSPPTTLQTGSTGDKVRQLQYMLAILSDFIPAIPPVSIDGVYGSATKAAVLAAQRRFLLPETGTVDARTWNEIYDQFSGIENTALRSKETFPAPNLAPQASNSTRAVAAGNFNQRRVAPGMAVQDAINQQYRRTTTLTQFPGQDLRMGMQDPVSQEVIR